MIGRTYLIGKILAATGQKAENLLCIKYVISTQSDAERVLIDEFMGKSETTNFFNLRDTIGGERKLVGDLEAITEQYSLAYIDLY